MSHDDDDGLERAFDSSFDDVVDDRARARATLSCAGVHTPVTRAHTRHVWVYDFTRGVARGGNRGWRRATTLERGDGARGIEKPRTGDDDDRESERGRGRMTRVRVLNAFDARACVHGVHGGA